MVIAKIRNQNRITIPQDVMDRQDLHVGDEIYFEISGVIGRDVTISHTSAFSASSTIYDSTGTGSVQ